MAPPNVSVGIPFYNASSFLGEAIESVLRQSYDDFELILADDASEDDSLEIARSFSDKRIRILDCQRNGGAPNNFNRCVRAASGAYITIFHADDVMHVDNLRKKVAVLDAFPAVGLVYSNVRFIDETGGYLSKEWEPAFPNMFVKNGIDFMRNHLLYRNAICAPAVFMRRSLLQRTHCFDTSLSHTCDWDMWVRLCALASIGYIPEQLIFYRRHQKNDSREYERNAEGLRQHCVVRCSAVRQLSDRSLYRTILSDIRLRCYHEMRESLHKKRVRSFCAYFCLYISTKLPFMFMRMLRFSKNTRSAKISHRRS
jgi:glycosyltransferase involved in cell wall biosynthesis